MTDPLSLTQAKRLASNADTLLLRATRSADLETPIGAFLRLDDGTTPAYLLESVEGGERLGRYSFLGVGPRRLLEVRDGKAADPGAARHRRSVRPRAADPDRRCARPARSPCGSFVPRRRVEPTEGMPRFTGGAVGALATTRSRSSSRRVPLPDAGSGRHADGGVHRDGPRPRLRPPDPHAVGDRVAAHRATRTSRAATGSPRTRSSRRSSGRRARRPPSCSRPPRRAHGAQPNGPRKPDAAWATTSTSTRSRPPRTRSPPARRSRSCSRAASRSTSRRTRRPAGRSTASGCTAASAASTRARTCSSSACPRSRSSARARSSSSRSIATSSRPTRLPARAPVAPRRRRTRSSPSSSSATRRSAPST